MAFSLHNLPLPKNRSLRALATFMAAGLLFIFWPFVLGFWLGRMAYLRIASKRLRYVAVTFVGLTTFFFGTVWAAAFFSPGSYALPDRQAAQLVSPGTTSSPSATPATTPVPASPTPNPSDPASIQPQGIGQRTKTSGCQASGALPDKACTPGAVFASVTKEQVCQSGYSSSVRSVSDSEKAAVYAEYGITTHTSGQYEVDHYISLELGGSNDIANLWPEPAAPVPGFHEKDRVENYLHSQLCSGILTLAQVQQQIASDWTVTYRKIAGTSDAGAAGSAVQQTQATATPPPMPAAASYDPANPPVKKSSTGICHAQGTTYYDRTTVFTPYETLQACLDSGGRLPLK